MKPFCSSKMFIHVATYLKIEGIIIVPYVIYLEKKKYISLFSV